MKLETFANFRSRSASLIFCVCVRETSKAIDGSSKGVPGRDAVCAWAVVLSLTTTNKKSRDLLFVTHSCQIWKLSP